MRVSTAAASDFAVDGYRWWALSGTRVYKYLMGTCLRNISWHEKPGYYEIEYTLTVYSRDR